MHETRDETPPGDSHKRPSSISAPSAAGPPVTHPGPSPRVAEPPSRNLRRLLILGLGGLIVVGIVVFKLTRTYEPPPPDPEAGLYKRPAPLVSQQPRENRLLDSRNRLFRLETYLGRHPILIVFYDGRQGPNADPLLRRLRDEYPTLEKRRYKVIGVSSSLPQEVRRDVEEHGEFPFPLLTDLEPTFRVHNAWGRVEPAGEGFRPLTGMFHIDQAGQVAWEQNAPRPIPDPNNFLEKLLKN